MSKRFVVAEWVLFTIIFACAIVLFFLIILGPILYTQSFHSNDCNYVRDLCTKKDMENICAQDKTLHYCMECWNKINSCQNDKKKHDKFSSSGWNILCIVIPIFVGVGLILTGVYICLRINCQYRFSCCRVMKSITMYIKQRVSCCRNQDIVRVQDVCDPPPPYSEA